MAAIVVAAYGCALDWTVPRTTSAPVDAGADRDGEPITTVPPVVSGDSGDPTGADTGGTSGGCSSNADCAQTDMCIFPAFDCGASGQGTCAPRSANVGGCAPNTGTARYCGCDGQLYETPCSAFERGVDLGTSCKPQVPDNGARVGFVICAADGGVAVEDKTRPRTEIDRCEVLTDMTCATDCVCIQKVVCAQSASNGKCENGVVYCN